MKMNRTLITAATLTTALCLSASSPAMAWGDREQGILTGIAGLTLWNKLNQPASNPVVPDHPVLRGHRHEQPVYVSGPVVVQSTSVCRDVPVKNQAGKIIEFQRICD